MRAAIQPSTKNSRVSASSHQISISMVGTSL
jgi:hypothetical protein